jgi:predicted methyltransferase
MVCWSNPIAVVMKKVENITGLIYTTQDTAKLIKAQDWTLPLTRRGTVAVKGKGSMVSSQIFLALSPPDNMR